MNNDKISKHLYQAQFWLRLSSPKTDLVAAIIKGMLDDTKWHGDIDGTRMTLDSLIIALGKLTHIPPATTPDGKPLVQGTSQEMVPGIQETVGHLEKAKSYL